MSRDARGLRMSVDMVMCAQDVGEGVTRDLSAKSDVVYAGLSARLTQ